MNLQENYLEELAMNLNPGGGDDETGDVDKDGEGEITGK